MPFSTLRALKNNGFVLARKSDSSADVKGGFSHEKILYTII